MIRPALAPTARRWRQPARVHSGLRGSAYALRLILLARCATPPSARRAGTSFPHRTQEAPRAKAGLGCLRRELLQATCVKFAAPPVTQVLCYRIAAPVRHRRGKPAAASGVALLHAEAPSGLPPGAHQAASRARIARADARAADLALIIAELQAAGVTSLSGISTVLNARGIRTPHGHLTLVRVTALAVAEAAALAATYRGAAFFSLLPEDDND
jgi:hypothetical protein